MSSLGMRQSNSSKIRSNTCQSTSVATSSHGTTCGTIVRCQRNADTIDRTRYEPRTLEAIITLRQYPVFSTNMSLVEEEMLVVWWIKRRQGGGNEKEIDQWVQQLPQQKW